MKRVFKNARVNYSVQKKYNLSIDEEGITYVSADGKKSFDIKFADMGSIFLLRYCNSNQHYSMTFLNLKRENIGEIDTDIIARPEHTIQGHNVLETKSVLIAFAENKLTEAFPDNLDALDLEVAFSFKEKGIRLKDGVLIGAKHQVKLSDIRRVICASNGTLSYLLLYTKEKGGFWSMPDMKVPVNELTLPILEAVMAKNTGRGIDFSRGNGFDQKTSEYILQRYMNSTFFMNEDGSVTDDWHKIAYDHVQNYHSDIVTPESMKVE